MSTRNIHFNTDSYKIIVAWREKNTWEEWDVLEFSSRDVRRNAVSRTRSPSLRRVPAHCLPGATHPYESLSPGAETATTCRTDCPG